MPWNFIKRISRDLLHWTIHSPISMSTPLDPSPSTIYWRSHPACPNTVKIFWNIKKSFYWYWHKYFKNLVRCLINQSLLPNIKSERYKKLFKGLQISIVSIPAEYGLASSRSFISLEASFFSCHGSRVLWSVLYTHVYFYQAVKQGLCKNIILVFHSDPDPIHSPPPCILLFSLVQTWAEASDQRWTLKSLSTTHHPPPTKIF